MLVLAAAEVAGAPGPVDFPFRFEESVCWIVRRSLRSHDLHSTKNEQQINHSHDECLGNLAVTKSAFMRAAG